MSTSFKSTSGGDGTVEVDALTVTNTLTVSGTAINATEIAFLDGVTAGTVAASKAVVVDADKHIDTIVIADGGLKLGATTGTAVTSTAAELNFLDGSVAGTAVASKAAVLGTNKNLDTIVIADSGLFLGDGAGTAVTSTAAELNILDGVTSTAAELNFVDGSVAGTTVASKALVVGTNKETDVLALPVSGLKIGAGAGTAVDRTAAEINLLAQGVAAGYKIARGTVTPVSASDTVVTSLATVVAVIVQFKGAPTVTHMFNAGDIGDQAGTPAAGSFLLKSYKPTATGDVTPTASSTPWSAVDWVAIGT